ncbi:glycosyltransferase [Mycobacterium sp. ML4]
MKVVVAGYGSRGDVEPCAALGRELSRRGHEVMMAVSPDRVDFVESAGLRAAPYGPDTREQMTAAASVLRTVGHPISALPHAVEQLSAIWADKTSTLTSLAQGADVLVAGFNEQQLAANVADYHGISLVGMHFFPPQLVPSGPLSASLVAGVAKSQRRALGLPAAAGYGAAALELQGYDEFCMPGVAATWGQSAARRPFVGALTLSASTDTDAQVLSWIGAGTPPICFGLGSTPIGSPARLGAMIAGACARLGERALICSGRNDFTALQRADHVMVVDTVNHHVVLPACRAMVHHGGAGTTAAGLRAGIPAVVLWLWLDQPIWAAALERLEVGVALQLSVTTEDALTRLLRIVLTVEYADRAREVAARMTPATDSVAMAADLVQDVAGCGRSG